MDGLTLPNEGHVTGLRPSRQTRGMPPEAPVGMPEQRLHGGQIGSPLQKMRGETVAK